MVSRGLRFVFVTVLSGCELVLPVHETADGGADVAVGDAPTDTPLDTPSETGMDATSDAITSCSAPGLHSFFPIDEGSGASFQDCVSHKNALLSPPYVWEVRDAGAGSPHPAITFLGPFDGGDGGSYASVANSTYNFPSGGTIALWLRVDQYNSTVGYVLTTRTLNQQGEGWVVGVGGSPPQQIWFSTGGTTALANVPGPNAGVWAHVAIVYQPAVSVTIYVNGSTTGPVTITQTEMTNNYPLWFGQLEDGTGKPDGKYLEGSLSEVRIFDRPLDASEVMALAQQ